MSTITNSLSTVSLSQLLQSLRTQQDTASVADDGNSSNKKKTGASSAEATGYGPPQLDSAALFQLLGLSQTSVNGSQNTDTSTDQQDAQDGLKQLASAIKAGDLDAAKKAYTSLQQTLKADGVDTTDTNNPFAKLLGQLGSDLNSGDIATAQKDLASIQPPPPPFGSQQADGNDGFANDVGTLFSAIKAGNLDDAKAAYAKLQANKPADAPSGGAFDQLLDKIGSALDSGDITSAQTTLASVPAAHGHGHRGGGAGATDDADASGTTADSIAFNSDGTITVTTTDADGNKTTRIEGKPIADSASADGSDAKVTSSATSDQWQSLLKEMQQILANSFATATSADQLTKR